MTELWQAQGVRDIGLLTQMPEAEAEAVLGLVQFVMQQIGSGAG